MEAPQSNGRDERWGHVKEVIENSASTTLCFTKLYYTTSYCTIRYYLYYTIQCNTILYHTILYYTIRYYLYYTIQCNTIQYYTILYYTILYILYLWQVVHIHKTSFLIYYCNILYNLCKLVEYIKLSFYDIFLPNSTIPYGEILSSEENYFFEWLEIN